MEEDFHGYGVCGEAWWPYDPASRTFFDVGGGCLNTRNDVDQILGSTTTGDSYSVVLQELENTETAGGGNPSVACSGSALIDWNHVDFINPDSQRSEEIYSDMIQQINHPSHVAIEYAAQFQAAFPDEFHPVQTLSPSQNQQMENLSKTKPCTNNTLFWKSMADANSQTSFQKHSEECKDFASEVKRIINECTVKRARLETSSPLPTFKVRKEKLGDRITVLQQLVSPFGKTDTASVLHEAIEHIKFLHDQLNVLSASYLKDPSLLLQHQQVADGKTKDQEWPMQDLKSRGLCLVPVSSTFPVATEASGDYFWTSAAFASFIKLGGIEPGDL